MCCIILCYIRYFAVFCSTCSFLNFESSHLYSNPLYYSFKNLVKVVAKWNVKKRFKLKICCNFTLYLIQYTMYHFISYQGEGIYFHVNCSQKYFVTINSYGIEKDFVLISLKFTTLFFVCNGFKLWRSKFRKKHRTSYTMPTDWKLSKTYDGAKGDGWNYSISIYILFPSRLHFIQLHYIILS